MFNIFAIDRLCIACAVILLLMPGIATAQLITLDSESISNITEIAFDKGNNRYIAGRFTSKMKLGDRELLKRKESKGSVSFIAKISEAGRTLWLKELDLDTFYVSIAVEGDRLFVLGRVAKRIDVRRRTLSTLLKTFDLHGNPKENTEIARMEGYTFSTHVEAFFDQQKHVIVLTEFSDKKPCKINGQQQQKSKYTALIISKYTQKGVLLWQTQVEGDEDGFTKLHQESFTSDQAGNVFISGSFAAEGLFGKQTLSTKPLAAADTWGREHERGQFLVKISADGDIIWAKNIATNIVKINNMIVSESGDLFLVGYHNSNLSRLGGNLLSPSRQIRREPHKETGFLARLNEQGELQWYRTVSSNGHTDFKTIALHHQKVFVAGCFAGVAKRGDRVIRSQHGKTSSTDIILESYSLSGDLISTNLFGSMGIDRPSAIAVDGKGGIHLVGYADSKGFMFSEKRSLSALNIAL